MTFVVNLILLGAIAYGAPPTEKDIDARIQKNREVDEIEKDATRRVQREPIILGAAIADREALSPTIPVNRDLAVPFTKRPETREDIDVRLRIVNAIWRTPLGQTLMSYLFDRIDPLELPSRSRQFLRLIFADGSQVTTRMAALQLLSEDLYVRQHLTEDAHRRLFLLQSDVQQEAMNLASQTKNTVVYIALFCFLISVPFGSPIVRQEASKIWSRPMAFFRRVVRRVKEDQKLESIALTRLFSRSIFENFEITKAVNTFFTTFGPVSTVWWFWREWGDAATGQIVHDKIMLLGLDALVRATEF